MLRAGWHVPVPASNQQDSWIYWLSHIIRFIFVLPSSSSLTASIAFLWVRHLIGDKNKGTGTMHLFQTLEPTPELNQWSMPGDSINWRVWIFSRRRILTRPCWNLSIKYHPQNMLDSVFVWRACVARQKPEHDDTTILAPHSISKTLMPRNSQSGAFATQLWPQTWGLPTKVTFQKRNHMLFDCNLSEFQFLGIGTGFKKKC